MAQQFLQGPNMHSPHGQMRSVGVPQVVEPEVRDAFSACRSEAVLNVPDVSSVPIPENVACLFPHLREDSEGSAAIRLP